MGCKNVCSFSISKKIGWVPICGTLVSKRKLEKVLMRVSHSNTRSNYKIKEQTSNNTSLYNKAKLSFTKESQLQVKLDNKVGRVCTCGHKK